MIPEMHDYRPKPPKQQLGSWPFWIVPTFCVWDYIIKMLMFLFLLPFFFGVVFTPTGLFFNFLFIDFIMYLSYKRFT